MQEEFEKLTTAEIESKKKEDWLTFLKVRFGFPEDYDLIKKEDLKKLNKRKYLSGLATGFFILLGILALSGVIYYLGNDGKFKSELICGNSNSTATCQPSIVNVNQTCEKTICQDCNCNLVCSNVTVNPTPVYCGNYT